MNANSHVYFRVLQVFPYLVDDIKHRECEINNIKGFFLSYARQCINNTQNYVTISNSIQFIDLMGCTTLIQLVE